MKRLEVELEYNCNCRKSEKSLPIRYYFDSRDIAQIIFDKAANIYYAGKLNRKYIVKKFGIR